MQHTKIKTFEDACKALNVDASILNIENLPSKHQAALIAHYKLVIIAEALNGGWQPDWLNHRERKYMPWFDVIKTPATAESTSGVGLSFFVVVSWGAGTTIGSRLCYLSEEVAEYAATQFKELYEAYYLIQ
jgi:hypothetical protein